MGLLKEYRIYERDKGEREELVETRRGGRVGVLANRFPGEDFWRSWLKEGTIQEQYPGMTPFRCITDGEAAMIMFSSRPERFPPSPFLSGPIGMTGLPGSRRTPWHRWTGRKE